MKLAKLKNLRKIYVKGAAFGDSSDEVQQKWEEFKKLNPKASDFHRRLICLALYNITLN